MLHEYPEDRKRPERIELEKSVVRYAHPVTARRIEYSLLVEADDSFCAITSDRNA
jgi:hypothetical protein